MRKSRMYLQINLAKIVYRVRNVVLNSHVKTKTRHLTPFVIFHRVPYFGDWWGIDFVEIIFFEKRSDSILGSIRNKYPLINL